MALSERFKDNLRIVADLQKASATLSDDFRRSLNLLQKTDDQFHRRLSTRALFAFVEGAVHFLRRNALTHHDHGFSNVLSEAEIALLKQESYEIKETGKAITREYYGSSIGNLRFAFSCHARVYQSAKLPDYGGEGWNSFREALRVRNRITHPKCSADLIISDDELAEIRNAFLWFSNSFSQAVHLASNRTKSIKNDVSGMIDQLAIDDKSIEAISQEAYIEVNSLLSELGLPNIEPKDTSSD